MSCGEDKADDMGDAYVMDDADAMDGAGAVDKEDGRANGGCALENGGEPMEVENYAAETMEVENNEPVNSDFWASGGAASAQVSWDWDGTDASTPVNTEFQW